MELGISKSRDLYLDLLRDTLTNVIYDDAAIKPIRKNSLRGLLGFGDGATKFDPALRQSGRDWPTVAHSMIGSRRMENLRRCACTVLDDGIPGDFIETGVWRGGACIMLRGVLKAYGDTKRKVFVADSFAGLPKPNRKKYSADRGDEHFKFEALMVSQAQVAENFRRYGLLDDQVCFLKGWFSETLPKAPIENLAVLRLDGDMYESTMDALTTLYPKVSPGGFVIVDDYHAVEACRKAVHDYLDSRNEVVKIEEIDGMGTFWRLNPSKAKSAARFEKQTKRNR
jgi:O-methyltransferase